MARFPSLPETPKLHEVFHRFPKGLRPLLELHDAILREGSELTRGQREFIAAYVSALNGCAFCAGSHQLIAEAFGEDAEVLQALLEDPWQAPVDDRMRPLLAYARDLTTAPARLTDARARAVFEAGWSEDALYDCILVVCCFNFMNRLVEGTGVAPDKAYFQKRRKQWEALSPEERRASSYLGWARQAGILDG